MDNINDDNDKIYVGHVAKQQLTAEEIEKMEAQNSRLVSDFQAMQLEKNAKKHWDLFYKRNEVRFFKDRHWTTREFEELLGLGSVETPQCLFEVGCGVGNLIYPLLEDNINFQKIFACDLSPRAIEFVKSHKLYDPDKVKAFQTDITMENCFDEIDCPIDIATLVFVLSAIHPDKFKSVTNNLYKIINKNGVVLFRDYGRYDMAQLRFKAGHKISENLYMRQDGTRSYYFTTEEVQHLFESAGFKTINCTYIQRRFQITEGIKSIEFISLRIKISWNVS
ncbi:hypothetical protein TSAR_001429 [Trichomalopsis sarcophagae]|uniref:tRNA N(3)-methylcytidine methyltransferase n=1 Tax=Trichomalopsis sarcophagae TaxID=543379 RepID=A0A232EFH6_9HYME|nr:hypothetical protein TSAR_001429 [Trichomalopsis sarcophagae]